MNLELFNETKWRIISEIIEKPQSPIELSSKFGTTISNILQQLKILEYAGIVKKRKKDHKGPGKAKTLYSLKNGKTFIINLDHNGARQKEIKKTDHQSLTTNIWLYAKEEEKYYLEKFFWANEDMIEASSLILLKKHKGSTIELEIISKKEHLKEYKVQGDGSKVIRISYIDKIKEAKDRIILLDKNNIISGIKGGNVE